MEEQGLPGLQARYEFVPAGEAVELRLRLRFDPAEAGPLEAARGVWLELRGRLAGGTGTKLPPATASLITSLAAGSLTVTADGGGLRERLADFATLVAAGPAPAAAPIAVDLAFSLTRAGVADLPSDVFELGVRLDVGAAPVAIALPRLDGDPDAVAFAAAFEQAWQGFDGSGGGLALARECGPGPTALWCVRTGTAHGIALARAASAEIEPYAVPPLSTWPLAGTIEQVDGGAIRVEAIDLDHWWDLFAAEFWRLAATADSGDLRGRFERVRGALARAMAGRLVPVAGNPAGEGIEEVRAVFEGAAAVDLRSRPVVAAAAVEVSTNPSRPGKPGPVLHGHAATPSEAAGAAAVSPGAVRLEAGRRSLAYAVPPSFEDRPWHAFSIRFEGDRIEREGAPPLCLILRANAPGADLGRQSVPVPLIGVPGPLSLSVAAAMASPSAESLSAALAWTVEIAIPATPAAQDRLELAVAFDGADAPVRSPDPVPEDALFGALGRAVRFGGALPAEPAPNSLAQFAVLAEAVADALPGWRAPAQAAPPLPGEWRYAIDFGGLPALTVTRETQGSGRSPPWPEVTGYCTPTSEEATARYEPEGPVAAGLRISVPGLRLLADRDVRVHGRVRRNGSLAEAVDPAFVYWGASASSEAVSPWLEWQAPQPEPPAVSLAAALGALLAALDEKSKRPYALGFEMELVQQLEPAGESPLETRIPLGRVPRVTIGGAEGVGIADLTRELAELLASARAGIGPGLEADEMALAIALSDEAPARGPLARLTVRIPVPGDEAWWSPARA